MKIEAEQKVNVEIKNSEAELAVAESKAVSVTMRERCLAHLSVVTTCSHHMFVLVHTLRLQ